MRSMIIIAITIFHIIPVYAGIIINEVSAGGSSDWIELRATSDTPATDISPLFTTMYYGSNERISGSPVTISGEDIPGTPFDERFAVIHFSVSGESDETDEAGDINKNGVRDLYCANYGLWNTDCVVSIDSDDDPKNGGIIDFVAFSNRDGSLNSTIAGYMKSASDNGEWAACSSLNPQDCMSPIGADGMNSYSTLSRRSASDTNTPDDFIMTPYATPGRENIINPDPGRRKTAAPLSEKIFHTPGQSEEIIPFRLFIYRECSLRVRIFNTAGTSIYSSDLITGVTPGYFTFEIRDGDLKGKKLTGLYLMKLEAYSDGRCDKSTVYLVMIRR